MSSDDSAAVQVMREAQGRHPPVILATGAANLGRSRSSGLCPGPGGSRRRGARVNAGCRTGSSTIAVPAPEPTLTPTLTPTGVAIATATPAPEHLVTLLVVSDGSHDSLLLECERCVSAPEPDEVACTGGGGTAATLAAGSATTPRPADGVRLTGGASPGCWERAADVSCWKRDDDLWRTDFGAWTDIPGSGASTRSFEGHGASAPQHVDLRGTRGRGNGRSRPITEYGTRIACADIDQDSGPTTLLDIYAQRRRGGRRAATLARARLRRCVIPDGVRVTTSGTYEELAVPVRGPAQDVAALSTKLDSGVDDVFYGDKSATLDVRAQRRSAAVATCTPSRKAIGAGPDHRLDPETPTGKVGSRLALDRGRSGVRIDGDGREIQYVHGSRPCTSPSARGRPISRPQCSLATPSYAHEAGGGG